MTKPPVVHAPWSVGHPDWALCGIHAGSIPTIATTEPDVTCRRCAAMLARGFARFGTGRV